jgi:hypothetical protein
MRVGLTRIPSQQAYEARNPAIPRIGQTKDTAKRHRWDALYAAGAGEWINDVYKYANDEHIDTALKAVVKELSK